VPQKPIPGFFKSPLIRAIAKTGGISGVAGSGVFAVIVIKAIILGYIAVIDAIISWIEVCAMGLGAGGVGVCLNRLTLLLAENIGAERRHRVAGNHARVIGYIRGFKASVVLSLIFTLHNVIVIPCVVIITRVIIISCVVIIVIIVIIVHKVVVTNVVVAPNVVVTPKVIVIRVVVFIAQTFITLFCGTAGKNYSHTRGKNQEKQYPNHPEFHVTSPKQLY